MTHDIATDRIGYLLADVDEVLANLVVHQAVGPVLERIKRCHEVDGENNDDETREETVENAQAYLNNSAEHGWPVLRIGKKLAG